jgi:hypothetical protein
MMGGMIPIQPFEIEVLRRMTQDALAPGVLDAAIQDGEFVGYEYNGYGYYLSFRHPQIPSERVVCSTPDMVAEADGIEAGFVVFLEANKLTLECFPVGGDPPIPENFRTQSVRLTA